MMQTHAQCERGCSGGNDPDVRQLKVASSAQAQLNPPYTSADVMNKLERCNAMSLQQAQSARQAASVILLRQRQNECDDVTNELERCNAMSPQQARSARQAAATMQPEQHG